MNPGDVVIELHLANDRSPQLVAANSTVAWACRIAGRVRSSFEQLACYVATYPEASGAKAVHGRLAFSLRRGFRQLSRLGSHYGLDVFEDHAPRTLGRCIHDLGEDILPLWMLLWIYNPASIKYSASFHATRGMEVL